MDLGKKIRVRNGRLVHNMLTNFDNQIIYGAKFEDTNIISLPTRMRLLKYFLVNIDSKLDKDAQISHKVDGFAEQRYKSRTFSMVKLDNKLEVQLGSNHYVHHMARTLTNGNPCNYICDLIELYSDDDQPNLTLHSANIKYVKGDDPQEINKIASIINHEEDFFIQFLKEHYVPSGEYKLIPTAFELIITPKHGVNPGNFSKKMSGLITVTNEVLTILKNKYHLEVNQLKDPNA